jgi:hypothetical protein
MTSKKGGQITMTGNSDNSNTQPQQPPTPNPALKRLDRLVGTWKVFGPEIDGQVTFEWLDGGFFLVQRFDLDHNGHHTKGIEVIGYGRSWDGTSSQDCTSHLFDNDGNAFTYVWEVEEDYLTIWGGERGSPAFFKGKFSDDGNTLTGAWEWPGGGYESTSTRVTGKSD